MVFDPVQFAGGLCIESNRSLDDSKPAEVDRLQSILKLFCYDRLISNSEQRQGDGVSCHPLSQYAFAPIIHA